MTPQDRIVQIKKELAVIQEVKKAMIGLHTTLITDFYRPKFAELGVGGAGTPQYNALVAERNKLMEAERTKVMTPTTEQKDLEAELRLLEEEYGR